MKFFLSILFCILYISSLQSCDFLEERPLKKEYKKQKVKDAAEKQSVKKTIPQKLIPQKEEPKNCMTYLGEQPEIIIEKKLPLKLKIDSNKIFNEASMSKWLMKFTENFYLHDSCDVKEVYFYVKLTDEVSYLAESHSDDFDSYHRKDISLAEWVRRFGFKQVDSITGMIKKLKEYRLENNHDEAKKILLKLMEKKPDEKLFLLVQANILLDEQNLLEASKAFERILEVYPDRLDAMFNLGSAYKLLGKFTDAISIYKSLLEKKVSKPELIEALEPQYLREALSNESIWANLADCYTKNRELDEAAQTLQKITQKSYAVKLIEANVMREQKKYDDAVSVLHGILTDPDDNGAAWFNLTLVYLDKKDMRSARQTYARLIQDYPKMAQELEFISALQAGKKAQGTILPSIDNKSSDSVKPIEPVGLELVVEEVKVAQAGGETKVDLPYQPVELTETGDIIKSGTGDVNEDGDDDDDEEIIELKKIKVDWSQVPYVPSKYPELNIAPDPEY